jgi:hypothetical protein
MLTINARKKKGSMRSRYEEGMDRKKEWASNGGSSMTRGRRGG